MRHKLQKENPNIDIKKFVYETMLNNGELMIDNFLQKIQPNVSNTLYDLLTKMLQFHPQPRFDIYQVLRMYNGWIECV